MEKQNVQRCEDKTAQQFEEKVQCSMRSPGAKTGKGESMEEGFSASNLCIALQGQMELAYSVQPWAQSKEQCRESQRIRFQFKNFLTELSNSEMGCHGRQWASSLRGKQADARQTLCNQLLWVDTFLFPNKIWKIKSLFLKYMR